MEYPHLIDAAFVRFCPEWRDRKEELTNTTIVKEPIKFNDFMKYKAIIDIDGNNWRYVMSTIPLIHLMTIHEILTSYLICIQFSFPQATVY